MTNLERQLLSSFIRGPVALKFGLSSNAAKFVECEALQKPRCKNARKWVECHPAGSLRVTQALAFVSATKLEHVAQHMAHIEETRGIEKAEAIVSWDPGHYPIELSALGQLVLSTEKVGKARTAAFKEALQWWEREGKFEDELENRGEMKYYLAANECAALRGELPQTPEEYLAEVR